MRLTLFLTFILFTNLLSQNEGRTGYSFLKIGTGAAETSLAEAISSRLVSTASLNYNPALIAESKFASITFMHNEWIQDLRSEFLTSNFKFFGIPLFITINSTKISNIEIRTKPGDPEGIFDAQYFYAGIGSGFEILDEFSTGIQIKYIYENIYVDESNGYAFDLGFFKRNLIKVFNAALSLRNFGKVNQLSSESSKLPSELRFGLSYNENLSLGKFSFFPSVDFQKYLEESNLNLLVGLQTNYNNLISFRLGYNSGRDLNNFSFGLGIVYSSFSFDYAFLPFKENFGNANLISISVKL